MSTAPQKSESPAATGQTQYQNTEAPIVAPPGPDEKAFTTAAARFALLGHSLQRVKRAQDGRDTYVVSRWTQSRTLSHWNDVLAFLAQIGGNHGL